MADDALDALAPSAATPTPAPAVPSPAAPVASPAPSQPAAPSAAPAPAAPTPAAVAPPAPDGAAMLQALSQQLGIPADELRASLDLTRRMRAEHERRQSLEREADPGYQAQRQREQAFERFLAESPAYREMADYLHAQRADGAERDMVEALGELGITFDESKESQALRAEYADLFADRINANPRLVERYNGTPAERRAVIRELVAAEEKRTNAILLRQNAATLRDHASRAAQLPRGGRSVTVTPQVRQERSTATDPTLRRRENNAIAGRQLDDIWAHHN